MNTDGFIYLGEISNLSEWFTLLPAAAILSFPLLDKTAHRMAFTFKYFRVLHLYDQKQNELVIHLSVLIFVNCIVFLLTITLITIIITLLCPCLIYVSPLACPGFHLFPARMLLICSGLWIYLRGYKKNLVTFWSFLWCGYLFSWIQRNFRKIQRKIGHRAIFALLYYRKVQST